MGLFQFHDDDGGDSAEQVFYDLQKILRSLGQYKIRSKVAKVDSKRIQSPSARKSMVSSFACVTDISKYSLNPSYRESGQGKDEKPAKKLCHACDQCLATGQRSKKCQTCENSSHRDCFMGSTCVKCISTSGFNMSTWSVGLLVSVC